MKTVMSLIMLMGLVGCTSAVWHAPADPAVPDVWPLGSLSAAHWHTMETNAEASDFVIHRSEFVRHSSMLTALGRSHVMEIAARMPSVPFPVLVEPEPHDTAMQLDLARRQHVIQLLTELGVSDASSRTVVSLPYSQGQRMQ
ncbi:MAG: hypothetical protein NXI04_19175 [Planctomycetaceae bacterium]|nr:hypothetical protein [Planctomycetaceae bacterium]